MLKTVDARDKFSEIVNTFFTAPNSTKLRTIACQVVRHRKSEMAVTKPEVWIARENEIPKVCEYPTLDETTTNIMSCDIETSNWRP